MGQMGQIGQIGQMGQNGQMVKMVKRFRLVIPITSSRRQSYGLNWIK